MFLEIDTFRDIVQVLQAALLPHHL